MHISGRRVRAMKKLDRSRVHDGREERAAKNHHIRILRYDRTACPEAVGRIQERLKEKDRVLHPHERTL